MTTLAELRAIDPALAESLGKPHHNKKLFTAEQDRLILVARKAGVKWPPIAERFEQRWGWRPCLGTLLTRYRELEEKKP